MQQPASLRRALTLGFGTALALGSLPSVVFAASGGSASQVGTANFDRVQERLMIPVKGPTPRIVVRRLAPRQYVADLAGSTLISGEAQGQRLRSPALAGWSLDEEPATRTVRLRMTLTTDVQPRVRFDRRTGGYVVSFATPAPVARKPAAQVKVAGAPRPAAPHKSATRMPVKRTVAPAPRRAAAPAPALSRQDLTNRLAQRRLPLVMIAARDGRKAPLRVVAAPTAAPAPRLASRPVAAPRPAVHQTFISHAGAAARVGVPKYDTARGLLVVPISGNLKVRDLDVVRLSQRWSYLDIPHSRPTFTGVRYENRADKFFQRWVMARRPQGDVTRISFALGAPANIDVELAGNELLIAVRHDAPMLGSAPKAKPAVAPVATAVKPVETAVKPVETPVRPVETPVKPVETAVKPVETSINPETKPAPRIAVKPATRPAPIAVARRNPIPGGVIETRLRRPFYDAERFGLVIPYEGRTPMYRWRAKGERGVKLELKGDVVNAAHLQPEVRRHAAVGSWKFDRRPEGGALALEMSFARPSELVVAADPERKQLLLIPQPRMHGERASEKMKPQAALDTVGMDRDGTNLFIPFQGKVPQYTIEQVNPSFAYIDFERAALREAGVQFYAPDYHPTVNYWMVTQPEGTTTVRLAVALARPGAAAVYQDPSQRRLVVVVGDNAPVVQATGPRTPRMPDPWPGAIKPGEPAGQPVSLKEAS